MTGRATALSFSADGRSVAAGWPAGHVLTYDAATGRKSHRIKGSSAVVRAVALSPDAGRVAWSAAANLHRWTLRPLREVKFHRLGATHFLAVTFHPIGEFFATANGDGKIDYWDARTGSTARRSTGASAR